MLENIVVKTFLLQKVGFFAEKLCFFADVSHQWLAKTQLGRRPTILFFCLLAFTAKITDSFEIKTTKILFFQIFSLDPCIHHDLGAICLTLGIASVWSKKCYKPWLLFWRKKFFEAENNFSNPTEAPAQIFLRSIFRYLFFVRVALVHFLSRNPKL